MSYIKASSTALNWTISSATLQEIFDCDPGKIKEREEAYFFNFLHINAPTKEF